MNVNNNNIKFEIGLVTLGEDGLVEPWYYVDVEDQKLKDELSILNKKELELLISWFETDDKDWAANILLYAKFQKKLEDMDVYPVNVWRQIGKSQDLNYWQEMIKNIPPVPRRMPNKK